MFKFVEIKIEHLAILRRINLFLTEYNFFIAFCSLAFVAFFSLLMKFPFPAELYIFTFCSTLSTYNLFRAYPTFQDFLTGHKYPRFYLISIGFIACFICFLMLPIAIEIFYVVVGCLTLLYKFNIPGLQNLRSIPYMKLVIITLVWLLSGSVFLLVHLHENSDHARIAGLMVMQFCFIISISIPFDVFGLMEDDMTTIPSKLGIQKALWISKSLLFVYYAAAILIHQRMVFLHAAGIVAVVTFTVIHFSPCLKRKSMQYYLLDGTIIAQTLIFYLLLN